MKNFIIFLLSAVLLLICAMPTAYADGVALPEYVDIGLKYGTASVTSAVAEAGSMSVTDVYGTSIYDSAIASSATVTYQNGSIVISQNGNTLVSYAGDIMLTPLGGIISLDGVRYRGSIKFLIKNSALTVVNHVKMDDYLCGVVPKEIGGSSPAEALKAQAVCARSYTARFIGRHSDSGFDLCTSQHCQVYGGVSAETDAANAAVKETSGVIAMYGENIAELYYFASDGGATEDVRNVWGSTQYPYLAAVDDPYETEEATHHTWSVTFTPQELTELFSSYGLGEITDISVVNMSEKGAVIKLEVVGTLGSKIFERESCRTVFGGKIYSQAYTVTKNYADASGAPSAISSEGVATLPSTVYVIGADGTVVNKIEDMVVISSGGESSFDTSSKVVSYTINGRGYGHLVGMSQWGAIAMAKQGFTYEQILSHYYTGITIVKK